MHRRSKQINSRSLQNYYIELKNELNNVNERIASTIIEFRDTASTGSLREDFAHVEAENKLTRLNIQKQYLLEDIQDVESITTKLKDLNYVPKSYIDIYSTFRLQREDTGEFYTLKVYPGSISDPVRGTISSEAPIYKLLEGKERGDTIITIHRITGEPHRFIVMEVY